LVIDICFLIYCFVGYIPGDGDLRALLPDSSSNRVGDGDGSKSSLGEGKEGKGSRELEHEGRNSNEWKESKRLIEHNRMC
jgi:hypothetical protein